MWLAIWTLCHSWPSQVIRKSIYSPRRAHRKSMENGHDPRMPLLRSKSGDIHSNSMRLVVIILWCCLAFQCQGIPAGSLSQLSPSNVDCQDGQFYNSSGTSFNASCNVEWGGNDLQVTFVTNFSSCIDQCSAWNSERSPDDIERCVGVAWCREKYGPDQSTRTCYLKWSMPTGEGKENSDIDSAQLQLETVTVDCTKEIRY